MNEKGNVIDRNSNSLAHVQNLSFESMLCFFVDDLNKLSY